MLSLVGFSKRARDRRQQREAAKDAAARAIRDEVDNRIVLAQESIPPQSVATFRSNLDRFRRSDGVFQINGWGFLEAHLASIIPTFLAEVDTDLSKLPVWSSDGRVRRVAPWLVDVVSGHAKAAGMTQERFAGVLAGAALAWHERLERQDARAIPGQFHDYVRLRSAMTPDELDQHEAELNDLRVGRNVAFQLAHAYQLLASGQSSQPIVSS